MWQTAEEAGLDKKEISEICKKLWKEEKSSKGKCHDCDARIGTEHGINCDTARCSECGGQLLSCGCKNGQPDVWTGIWPGIKECYEQKLITRFGPNAKWSFDLNREAVLSMQSKKNKK